MPILDRSGRLFGRIHVLDAAVLLGAVLAGVAAYHLLTAGNRVAPPFALPENSAWLDTTLWLPRGQAFLRESLHPGSLQHDPRTGDPIAEIIGTHSDDNGIWVEVRLWSQRDAEGRWLYRSRQLLPGRELEIETDSALVTGIVARWKPAEVAP